MSQLQGAIAAARFGMGARPGEIAAASSDPRGWLKAQIGPNAALIPGDGLLSVKQVFAAPFQSVPSNDWGARAKMPLGNKCLQ